MGAKYAALVRSTRRRYGGTGSPSEPACWLSFVDAQDAATVLDFAIFT